MAEIYGYIRVSTKAQNEERQVIALEAFGVSEDKTYIDVGTASKRTTQRAVPSVRTKGCFNRALHG